jgi:hypothetical protein
MHDWELALGAQVQRLTPQEPTQRAAFLFGIRAGLRVKDEPLGGLQAELYGEGGGLRLPEETGARTYPYAGGGLTIRKDILVGKRKALQIYLVVGGRVGIDTRDSDNFGWFQAGVGVVLERR